MQLFDITNNFVNASDRSKSNAVFLILKQSSACIWWHRHQMQQFWHKKKFVSAFNFIAIECSNLNINCFSFDCDETECSVLTSKQFRQCIWWFQHQMQQFWHFIQLSMHLMTSILDAALTISSTNNRQRAFNRETIECSSSDITFNRQCIWWHQYQMQTFLISTICLPYNLITASHSFERFFLRHRETVDRLHTHSFD